MGPQFKNAFKFMNASVWCFGQKIIHINSKWISGSKNVSMLLLRINSHSDLYGAETLWTLTVKCYKYGVAFLHFHLLSSPPYFPLYHSRQYNTVPHQYGVLITLIDNSISYLSNAKITYESLEKILPLKMENHCNYYFRTTNTLYVVPS